MTSLKEWTTTIFNFLLFRWDFAYKFYQILKCEGKFSMFTCTLTICNISHLEVIFYICNTKTSIRFGVISKHGKGQTKTCAQVIHFISMLTMIRGGASLTQEWTGPRLRGGGRGVRLDGFSKEILESMLLLLENIPSLKLHPISSLALNLG